MKNFYLVFIAILLLHFPTTAQEGWFNQNPVPQALYLTDLVVFNDTAIIAVGNYGNMIKTTNDGKNWDVTNCFDGSRDYSRNFSFVDSVNGWYLSHLQEKVFRTSDGGSSWERVSILNGIANRVDFVNDQVGYIVGYDGLLLKTTDGGISWNSHSLDPSYVLTDIYFVNPDTGWIVGSQYVNNALDSALILKTDDGGLDWTTQFKGIAGEIGTSFNSVYFINELSGFVAGIWSSFLKTTNGGTDWIQYDTNLLSSLKSLNFINLYVGWGLTNDGKILKTLDGGETWVQQYSGDLGKINAFDFSDGNNGWAVGENGILLKTTDGGNNWVNIRKGLVEQLKSLNFINGNNAWVVGGNSTILNTINGGNEWNYQNIDTTVNLNSAHFTSENNGWVAGENGFILHTSNGGTSWNQQLSQTTSDLRSVYFINDQSGWIAGENGIVLNTTNGGASWTTKQVGWTSLENLNCVYFVNEDTGWVSGGRMAAVWYGTLYKSIDGGQNWSSVGQIGDDMSLIIDIFFQGNYGWLIGSSINSKKNYARTTDGGLTWTSEVLSHNMSKIFFLNENVGWIVGEGIIKTTDGGVSWTSLTSFCELPYVLTDLHFVSENVGWVIGQSGSILKTTNGGVTFVEEKKEKVIPSSLELEQNFPNPFNPSTKIRYSISQPSKVIIKIFDILGREIETLVNEEKPVGTYELTWNAVTLPSGVYFYQINAGEFIRTKKMLLIK